MNKWFKYYAISLVVVIVFASTVVVRRSALGAEQQQTVEYELNFPWMEIFESTKWLGPDGGIIVDIEFDPDNSNIVYAGTWGGGVFKSYDAGQTWQPAINGLGNLYIEVLAINPKNTDEIYAGTHFGKLYKSVNGGQSWTYASNGIQADAIVYSIAIDPNSPNRVYIGTRGISNNGNPPWKGILYSSTDYGQSWSAVLQNVGGSDDQDWAYSIEVHPKATNLVYAATHEHGIYRSENYGSSWAPANSGISDLTARAVVADPKSSSPKIVYMGVWKKTGVFKSTNAGDSWSLAADGLNDPRIYDMTIDPVDTDTLYLSTFDRGILKTNNGGDSWRKGGLNGYDIYDVAVNPGNNRILLSGVSAGGLYRSTNRGDDWYLSQNGIKTRSISGLVVDPDSFAVLYAATTDSGVIRSADGGETWQSFNTGLPIEEIYQLVANPYDGHVIYALTKTNGLYYYILGLTPSWYPLNTGLTSYAAAEPVFTMNHPFASRMDVDWVRFGDLLTERSAEAVDAYAPLLDLEFTPADPSIMYLATAGTGVARSLDGGLNWAQAGLDGWHVWSVAVHPQNANIVYAATNQSDKVLVTIDGGQNWTEIPLAGTIYDVVFSVEDEPKLIAGTSNGVFRYTGVTWEHLGMEGIPVAKLAYHPTWPNTLYAGTTNGAYFSEDGGETWVFGPDELAGMTIQAITYDPHIGRRVYFSTKTYGILKTKVKP